MTVLFRCLTATRISISWNILTVTSNVANDSPYGTFSEYARMNPYYSPYDANGQMVKNAALSVDGLETSEFVANPLYNSTLSTKIEQRYIDVTDNLYVEWAVLQGLKATLRFGITEKRTKADEFYPCQPFEVYRLYRRRPFPERFLPGKYGKHEKVIG